MDDFKLLFSLNGRITRSQYLLNYFLLILPLRICGLILAHIISKSPNDFSYFVGIILILLSAWMGIAVAVKRLHDLDWSGWLAIIEMIPFANLLLVGALCCLRGTDGTNRFGDEPIIDQPPRNLGLTYGALLLRLWLAVRAIQTGIEKYAGTTMSDQPVTIDGAANSYGLSAASSAKEYALSHYHGVPAALVDKFKAEPLMKSYTVMGVHIDPLKIYDIVLGPALLVLGITILLGIASRTSLFLLGLLYISLTWGLILIKQDDGVSWLGIHMIMIVMALMLAQYNRLAIFKKW